VQGEEAASKAVAVKGSRSNETIHIFAVASGHLYERLMKIMVLSIIKRTDRPVKFWFIKNYLSPKFKVRLSREWHNLVYGPLSYHSETELVRGSRGRAVQCGQWTMKRSSRD
jgi:hypothetical protein